MNLKEMKTLVKMNAIMRVETDPHILAEIAKEEARLEKAALSQEEDRKRISEAATNAFAEFAQSLNELVASEKKRAVKEQALLGRFAEALSGVATNKPVIAAEELTEAATPIQDKEEVPPPSRKRKPKSLVDAVVEKVSDTAPPPSMFIQPEPDVVSRDLQAIQNKLKMLEGWVSKISMTGPGGGAGSVDQLDHRTTAVVADSYNVGRHDYYIGVDYPGNVTIHLPTTVNNGRVLVIKDESGSAGFYPITVVGRVDNDPDGFILKVNNGAVQLIYRNGWRII